ncbi:unnamed protein product [Arabis nemorensis]|uniref:Uncharacterized protein n=1 Tax=Arabis nemorensis TaxID=586526 RepID=A0A565CPP4_9BRAS|nr:unnamed protein product [Arabis nemorensis]
MADSSLEYHNKLSGSLEHDRSEVWREDANSSSEEAEASTLAEIPRAKDPKTIYFPADQTEETPSEGGKNGKAKFKRVNYTDVAQESPAPGKGADEAAAAKQTGPSATPKRGSKRGSTQTEKVTKASLAAKKAGKRVVEPTAETAKKVSKKEVGKKRPTEVTAKGAKKKQRIMELTQKTASVEVAATGSEENPMTYDLSFNFKAKYHIATIPQVCAELCFMIPCSTEYDFPEPDDLIEKEAYQLFSGSVIEIITHGNLIIKKYDRRSWRLLKKLEGYPNAKNEAAKVPGLEKKIATQISALNDLSLKAEEARQRAKYTEEELEKMRAEKESLQSFHELEMTRLQASREYEVNQIIAKCDAKLQKIKESISDNEEMSRLSALMSQAMAINDYFTGLKKEGTAVSDDRFKALDANFKNVELEFKVLDVEEVTEDDFRMTPPH